MKFGLVGADSSVGKGENADYQDFSYFPILFSKCLCLGGP